jgi:cytidylate kinase
VLSVFIYAPQSYRVTLIKERDHVSANEALHLVQQNDTSRAHYIRSSYGADWRDPDEYHLMLNTAICPVELAADLIVRSAQDCCLVPLSKNGQPSSTPADTTTDSKE